MVQIEKNTLKYWYSLVVDIFVTGTTTKTRHLSDEDQYE